MDLLPSPPVPPAFQDRRTGLIVFGVFAILIGAVLALVVPLTILGQLMASRRLGTDFDASAAFVGSTVYGLLAVLLVWLGVGSILARRWARALLLCLGWIGLIIGLTAMPAVFVAMNSIGDTLRAQGRAVPATTLVFIKFVALATTFVIYIVVPGVAVLFYRSPLVRQTCAVRDPVERWTDRCPLPVLGLCVLKAVGAIVLLLILPIYGSAFPLAGTVVTGWLSRLLWVALLLFLVYAVRGFYRLELRVWWIYTVGAVLLWASTLFTLQRVGLVEFYRQMGLPERQLMLMSRNPLLTGNSLLWLSLLSMALWLGYLLFVRRFFRAPTNRPAAA